MRLPSLELKCSTNRPCAISTHLQRGSSQLRHYREDYAKNTTAGLSLVVPKGIELLHFPWKLRKKGSLQSAVAELAFIILQKIGSGDTGIDTISSLHWLHKQGFKFTADCFQCLLLKCACLCIMLICTHSGRFHCDEVLACVMLTRFTAQFKNAQVLRSRDPAVWAKADILVDVGGKYEPPLKLDHHQIEFQNCYPGYNVRLSSAGLVYLHYPQIIPHVIEQILQKEKHKLTFEPIFTQEVVKTIRENIYKNFIIYVDANDNGVDRVHEKDVSAVPTTLWSQVSRCNPMWWDETADQGALFKQAMEIVEREFVSEVRQALLGSIQTEQIVKAAFAERHKIHPSGHIVLLEKYVPWQKNIVQIEEQENCVGSIFFVIFPDKAKGWRIQAVSLHDHSFELRKGIKAEWRGIKDGPKLIELSQIEDIEFVHASGFIGGAKLRESAIKMGELSL